MRYPLRIVPQPGFPFLRRPILRRDKHAKPNLVGTRQTGADEQRARKF